MFLNDYADLIIYQEYASSMDDDSYLLSYKIDIPNNLNYFGNFYLGFFFLILGIVFIFSVKFLRH